MLKGVYQRDQELMVKLLVHLIGSGVGRSSAGGEPVLRGRAGGEGRGERGV